MHGFTTRSGGVSVGPLASLNLARRPGETDEALTENWRRVSSALGCEPDSLALVHQVHGAEVAEVRRGGGPLTAVAIADAAITRTPGLLLAVRVADCVPVLLVAPGGVGVAHAGWRGAAAGVVPATVRALCALVGCPPSAVTAVVGPSISAASYETGPEVVEALTAAGVPREVAGPSGPWTREHADVRAAVAHQLEALGVLAHHVAVDTATDPRMYSHRRDGPDTGRLAGVIAWMG